MKDRDSMLLEIAKSYESEEEFKAKNLPKYLLAKRARLLATAFPLRKETKLKGIYYLYYRHIVVYIGHSMIDLEEAIDSHKESTMLYDYVKYWTPHSDSDILVLYAYLSNKYKPKYNTNTGTQTLTLDLGNVMPAMGKTYRRDR